MLPTLKDVYIADKVVLVRTGFDVPLSSDGRILDDKRIRLSLPTIKYLLEHDARQVIILTHMGRPDPENPDPVLKTDVLASRLSELLDVPVHKVDKTQDFSNIPSGHKVIILENLRFDHREKSKDMIKRDDFGRELASLGNLYVNDSFSTCHRDHASMTSVPKFLPGVVGFSVEQEIKTISNALSNPSHPFISVIGGLKADKLNAVANLLDRVDKVLIGGALAFALLKAEGKSIGQTRIDSEGLSDLQVLVRRIKSSGKVVLPKDCLVAKELAVDASAIACSVDDIPDDSMALDIGPSSVEEYRSIISSARTVIWNGPMGVFEFENFSVGTRAVAEALADNPGMTIIGGGDSASAVEKFGLSDRMTLVSSGGGASLALFEGKSLVALDVLQSGMSDKKVLDGGDGPNV